MSETGYLPALRFRALTPYFDRWVRVTTRERALKRRLLDQLRIGAGDTVLDLGAGTGTLAIMIERRFPGARVVGLDADPEILAIARRKAEAAGAGVEFVDAMSTDLPLEDGSVAAVVSTLFFHHLDSAAKRATLAEVARVLRPGGELHVGDFGRPADPLQAALFMPVRVFDGFAVTADNRRGALPEMFEQAGLVQPRAEGRLRTGIGTLDLLSARRP